MTTIDHFISQFDKALRTVFAPAQARRASPAVSELASPSDQTDKTTSARLMRINHAGEVCAQALYQG
ncbi:MAG: demethoxyubiquinone hydroxylase family protein, partial [Burkholderiales bacterium]